MPIWSKKLHTSYLSFYTPPPEKCASLLCKRTETINIFGKRLNFFFHEIHLFFFHGFHWIKEEIVVTRGILVSCPSTRWSLSSLLFEFLWWSSIFPYPIFIGIIISLKSAFLNSFLQKTLWDLMIRPILLFFHLLGSIYFTMQDKFNKISTDIIMF